MGAELAWASGESEEKARLMTCVSNIMYDALDATGPRPVVTRSMVETAIKSDGIERVLALSKLNMRGLWLKDQNFQFRKVHDVLDADFSSLCIDHVPFKRIINFIFEIFENLNCTGLYFDGKKSTVRYEEDGEIDYPTVDHYTVILQPDKKYCGFCKTDGTGEWISTALC